MDGVQLGLADLDVIIGDLSGALAEFEDAVPVRQGLQDAVGRPAGRYELRGKVGDFEDCWNHTRGDLKDGMTKVRDHLQGIVDGFREADAQLAAQMTAPPQASGPVGAARAV